MEEGFIEADKDNENERLINKKDKQMIENIQQRQRLDSQNQISAYTQSIIENLKRNVDQLKKSVNEKEKEIEDLRIKINKKDERIVKIIKGYTQNMIELKIENQLFLQEIEEQFKEEEEQNAHMFGEFGENDIQDNQIRKRVNEKIKNLIEIYEKRIGEFRKEMGKIQNSYDEQGNITQKFDQRRKSISQRNELLFKEFLAQINRNFYIFWKIVQNEIGNKYIFENIFEIPVPNSGINYEEIAQLIQNSKIRENEFNNYKKILNQQLLSFKKQAQNEIQLIQENQKNQQKQFLKFIKDQNENISDQIKTLSDNLQNIYEQKIIQLQLLNESKISKFITQIQSRKQVQLVQKLRQKFCLLQWYFYTKLSKKGQEKDSQRILEFDLDILDKDGVDIKEKTSFYLKDKVEKIEYLFLKKQEYYEMRIENLIQNFDYIKIQYDSGQAMKRGAERNVCLLQEKLDCLFLGENNWEIDWKNQGRDELLKCHQKLSWKEKENFKFQYFGTLQNKYALDELTKPLMREAVCQTLIYDLKIEMASQEQKIKQLIQNNDFEIGLRVIRPVQIKRDQFTQTRKIKISENNNQQEKQVFQIKKPVEMERKFDNIYKNKIFEKLYLQGQLKILKQEVVNKETKKIEQEKWHQILEVKKNQEIHIQTENLFPQNKATEKKNKNYINHITQQNANKKIIRSLTPVEQFADKKYENNNLNTTFINRNDKKDFNFYSTLYKEQEHTLDFEKNQNQLNNVFQKQFIQLQFKKNYQNYNSNQKIQLTEF